MTLPTVVQGITLALWGLVLASYVRDGILTLRGLRARGESGTAASGVDPFESPAFQVPPVSIIAFAGGNARTIVANTRCMIQQHYPDHEVIVVCESRGGALDALTDAFALRTHQTPLRRTFRSRGLRRVYYSAAAPRLRVIEKAAGGRADAFNCGLNFARYGYACTVDSAVALGSDSLRSAMRPVIDDPDRVVAVHAQVLPGAPSSPADDRHEGHSWTLWSLLHQLQGLREWMVERVVWDGPNITLASTGAFGIWRTDLLQDIGGFAEDVQCEDADTSLRLQEHLRATQRSYRVLSIPPVVGRFHDDVSLCVLLARYSQTQRGMAHVLWRQKARLVEKKGSAFRRAILLTRAAGITILPLVRAGAVASLTVGWILGVFHLGQVALIAGTLVCAGGALTNLTLLARQHLVPFGAPAGFWPLMLAGMVEPLVAAPLRCVAGLPSPGRLRRPSQALEPKESARLSARSPTPTES